MHGQTGKQHIEDREIMGRCESCQKPWDMYRGKRRCPTCGVPSLICNKCLLADKEGRKKLGKETRCDLCVTQGITSKRALRENDEHEKQEYEQRMESKGMMKPEGLAPNPDQITRLRLMNMCRKDMDEVTLTDALPGITHIVWHNDYKSGKFLGQAWVEMATPDDASNAVAQDGKVTLFNRTLYVAYEAPDGKDIWPLSSSAIGKN